eukprot:189911-Pyramimonas_sp.AAC.1
MTAPAEQGSEEACLGEAERGLGADVVLEVDGGRVVEADDVRVRVDRLPVVPVQQSARVAHNRTRPAPAAQ